MNRRQVSALKTLLGILIIIVHILPFYIVISVALKAPQDFSSRWIMPLYFLNREEPPAAEEPPPPEQEAPVEAIEPIMPIEAAEPAVPAEDGSLGSFAFGDYEEEAPGEEVFVEEDVEEDLSWILKAAEAADAPGENGITAEALPPVYLENFREAWIRGDLGRALLNNTVISALTVFLVILVGSCAAYPLSRHRTKLNNFMYNFFVSCLIVPALTILVPLYKLMVDMGGINTHWGMILTLVTFQLPLSIFLFTGFIGSIPKELDEAALVDGCNRFAIFLRIIFPVLKPVTATVAILVSVNAWNDYQFSIFFLQTPRMYTISVALSQFQSQYISNVGMIAAGCIISAIPATVVFLCLQKYFIKGLTAGAVKG